MRYNDLKDLTLRDGKENNTVASSPSPPSTPLKSSLINK
jgi:hypothetical protein